MVFIVMGVSGCGKTTVGKLLAGRIAFPFHDADDFHSQGNLEKMNNGVPLTDEDRVPWLFDLAVHVAQWNRHGGAVLACSALKKQYRDMLDWNGKEEVAYIHLKGDRDLILGRMKDRTDHFFPPSLLESQFRNYFKKSDRQKGVTGSNLLIMLERRLDNIVFRLGFANSRAEARQLVMHSHFRINGKKVNIPSYLVSAGSVIEVSEKSRNMARIKESLETVARRGLPQWLELDKANFRGVLKALPTREDLVMPIQEQLIVELYSK